MTEEAPDCCRRSFAASIKDTAKRLLEDPTVAPRRVAILRMEVCESCDRYNKDSQTCEICGCFMPLKTAAANMRCPIDKWVEWSRED
jgi:hypothetical protein